MKQLDPKAVWLFFYNTITLWGVMFLAIFIFISVYADESLTLLGYIQSNIIVFLFILLVFLVLSYVWAKLSYKYYKYEIKDDAFRKESGVIYKKYVSIPYSRIQNVDIYRGIIARLIGLSDLHIQTAGSSGAVLTEGRLPGLSKQDAETVRDELIRKAKNPKDQGL